MNATEWEKLQAIARLMFSFRAQLLGEGIDLQALADLQAALNHYDTVGPRIGPTEYRRYLYMRIADGIALDGERREGGGQDE